MARLEGITIQNYRALRNVTLGRTFSERTVDPLPGMIAVIGPNGSGKSTLLDALGFLKDCLKDGVEAGCDAGNRGGFDRLRTKGSTEPIKLDLYYRETDEQRPISYSLWVGLASDGRPIVQQEVFRQGFSGQGVGQPFTFVDLKQGKGRVWAGHATEEDKQRERKDVKLDDPRQLAIASLGNLSEHPRIVRFRQFLEGWYLSYFVPDLARGLPMAGAHAKLSMKGDNLANYVQFLEKEHGKRFEAVLKQVAEKIPGVQKISHKRADDGRLLLQFNDQGYKDPFYAPSMSDGTLKYFAYMLMLEDPNPSPFIGIEEPENGLHHKVHGELAAEMRRRSGMRNGPQILVTTHSNFFVDALHPSEVFLLRKRRDGASVVSRAADVPGITGMYDDGIPLGSLWYSNDLDQPNITINQTSSKGAGKGTAR